MARRHVVGVAGLVGLLAVREPEGDLALDHIAPAGELAAVVRQPAEEAREVGVRRVRLEADGIAAVEVLEPNLEPSRAIVSDAVSFDTWACRASHGSWVARCWLETEAMRDAAGAASVPVPNSSQPATQFRACGPGGGDCSCRAPGGSDLEIDVGDVALHGANAEHELPRDVLVRESACDQPKDLGLTRREPADARRRCARTELLERLPALPRRSPPRLHVRTRSTKASSSRASAAS